MASNNTSSTTNKEQRQVYDLKRYMSYVNPGDKHTDFTSFIDEKIQQYRDESGERFNKRILAKEIGISYEMLKKIINQSKRTRKRDCIIAICVALGLSHFDTNKALELYSMATLNPNRPRDMVIIEAVFKSKCIEDVNEYLQNAGCSCLSIGNKKQLGSNDNEYYYPKPKYNIMGTEVYVYDFFAASTDRSLKDMYDPERFNYKATMYLEDSEKQSYKITVDDEYCLFKKSSAGVFELLDYYFSLDKCTDVELYRYFIELKHLIDGKAREIIEMLDDTRNYIKRIYANFVGYELNLYEERFNYEHPELGEYYLIESYNGKLCFSVTHKSMFMEKYMECSNSTPFGKNKGKVIELYRSQAELEETIDKETERDRKKLLYQRLQYFKEMMKDIDIFLNDLMQRRLFIRSSEMLNDDDIVMIYKAEKEFDCVMDEETGAAYPQKRSYKTTDGIVVTIDDLYRAYELQIAGGLEFICKIKAEMGSLDSLVRM